MQLPLLYAASFAVLVLTTPSHAQTAPTATATPVVPPASRKTMLRLGLRVNRGFETRDLDGLFAPVTLGLERRLGNKFSVYGNVLFNLRPLAFQRYYPRRTFIHRVGAELGGRYYYNQAKRLARGRAAGPFVGNYLALQASTEYSPMRVQNAFDNTHIVYQFSGLTALWGMQRRLGSLLVYDLSAGLGAFNSRRDIHYHYNSSGVYTGYSYSNRRLAVGPAVNLQLSFAR
ncbi:hypothetical protein [Hymenobacter crusticola]|uniref:DUF3575 domain-containing protein n=1 Tax=Hymenobacter crusticola TaxID=1770526 RepID=A0A243WAX0_9BACT|nr:hypothetical protein [Hymenobacter crusticola]OUJ71655.1 hypothetical protein BXP70_21490 [Hymenobacter crusticola]